MDNGGGAACGADDVANCEASGNKDAGVLAFARGVADLRAMMQAEMASIERPLHDAVEAPLDFFSSFQPSRYDRDIRLEAKWRLFNEDEAQRKCTELRLKVDKVHASSFARHALEKAAVAVHSLKELEHNQEGLEQAS